MPTTVRTAAAETALPMPAATASVSVLPAASMKRRVRRKQRLDDADDDPDDEPRRDDHGILRQQ